MEKLEPPIRCLSFCVIAYLASAAQGEPFSEWTLALIPSYRQYVQSIQHVNYLQDRLALGHPYVLLNNGYGGRFLLSTSLFFFFFLRM